MLRLLSPPPSISQGSQGSITKLVRSRAGRTIGSSVLLQQREGLVQQMTQQTIQHMMCP